MFSAFHLRFQLLYGKPRRLCQRLYVYSIIWYIAIALRFRNNVWRGGWLSDLQLPSVAFVGGIHEIKLRGPIGRLIGFGGVCWEDTLLLALFDVHARKKGVREVVWLRFTLKVSRQLVRTLLITFNDLRSQLLSVVRNHDISTVWCVVICAPHQVVSGLPPIILEVPLLQRVVVDGLIQVALEEMLEFLWMCDHWQLKSLVLLLFRTILDIFNFLHDVGGCGSHRFSRVLLCIGEIYFQKGDLRGVYSFRHVLIHRWLRIF